MCRETSRFFPKKRTGRKSVIICENIDEIHALLRKEPDITLSEMIETLSLPIKKPQFHRLLVLLGYSFKKKRRIPPDKNALMFKRFKDEAKPVSIENLISLDESAVNLTYTRLYGRAKTNEHVNRGVLDVRFARKSILSTIRLNGEICPFVFDGTLNKELFCEYIKSQLKPMLKPIDVLLLDNSRPYTGRNEFWIL